MVPLVAGRCTGRITSPASRQARSPGRTLARVKLYGIGTAKNEDDVIGDSIEHALGYCDKVIYIDNNSTDRTWDVINEKAAEHPGRVVAFAQITRPYVEGLREVIYNAFNDTELGANDWWMKLDADEFIAEDPRPVVDEAMAAGNDVIRAWHAQFYFTDVDLAAWERGEEDTTLPITERRMYYRTNWRQVHLWKNVPGEVWRDLTRSIPEQTVRIHGRAVQNRHYQYRDPDQIAERLATRMGLAEFPHVGSPEWNSVIRPAAKRNKCEPGAPLKIDKAFN